VILVDNASNDDLGGIARLAQIPLRLIRLPEHQSLAAAFNVGIDAASHEMLLLLHSDVVVESDPGLAAVWMEHQPGVGIAGARLFEQGNEPRRLLQLGYQMDRGRINPHPVAEKKWDTWREPVPVAALSTACVMLRRTAARFDERYWFRLEDVDFCHQYAQQGWEIVSLPNLRATHLEDGGLKQRAVDPAWAARQLASQLLYHERWCSDAPIAQHPQQPVVRGEQANAYHQQAELRMIGSHLAA
jgi:GT2 family glycosyltransferase